MLEHYENLLIRYKNQSYFIDDNELEGVILHNESKSRIKYMLIKFKYSKLGFCKHQENYIFDIIEFVKYALTRGYDWKLFGKPEWEELRPKRKNKFVKPKIKRYA